MKMESVRVLNAACYDECMSRAQQRPGSPNSGCHRRGEFITTVIVWLLLGAIVNIAVAWGIARWSHTHLTKPVSGRLAADSY